MSNQIFNMHTTHYITSETVTFEILNAIITTNKKLTLSGEAIQKIENCRSYLDEKIKKDKSPIYGINTGFGSLCNVKISENNLQLLQENLVMSHACGTGAEVPKEIVKLMLFLKIQSLSYGHSGVQLSTVERLIDFYNNDILPVIYTQGSLGASGDLAPLAHLSLPLIGKGEVHYNNERISGDELLEKFNWKKIELKSKEGLALLNGTQFMSAYGVHLILKSLRLSYFADLIGALSLEAFDGRNSPFNELIHLIRPHKGQLKTAARISSFLENSEIINQYKEHVQDPYSFRCIPQVHGATKDTIDHCATVIEREINAVTDNPTVFYEEDDVVSAGNFHGQPLALAMDFLAIAMAEMGSISERRVYKLISGTRGLPAFLVAEPGLNSGFMIPQYTAASIVSQNKQLCTPASIDTIDSSNGQEDHVSMGANAATKLYRVIDNCYTIQGIELLNASQGMDFRTEKSSTTIENLRANYRKHVPFVKEDMYLHPLIQKSKWFMDFKRKWRIFN